MTEQTTEDMEHLEPLEQEVAQDIDVPVEQENGTTSDSDVSDSHQPDSETPTLEGVAQKMGWAPKDQWRGPEDQWKPADKFVSEAHNINQHLKQELHKKDADYKERFDRQEKMTKQALEMQRQQLTNQYEQMKINAVELGDTDTYRAVSKEQQEALKRFDESVVPQPQQNGSVADPAVADFVARNRAWYGTDPAKTGAAQAIWGDYQGRFPSLPLSDIARMVDEDMAKFGTRTTSQSKPSASQVEGGGLRPIQGAEKKGWSSLPPEAKAAGESFISEGIYGKDAAKAKEAYAESYYNQ